mmetsp:Transcript_48923/g.110878  ORF Transcript_48923/g.110878 Transcript_48923/m.110878 type:complete len:121 (+) Transcript_48923:37-399(+)
MPSQHRERRVRFADPSPESVVVRRPMGRLIFGQGMKGAGHRFVGLVSSGVTHAEHLPTGESVSNQEAPRALIFSSSQTKSSFGRWTTSSEDVTQTEGAAELEPATEGQPLSPPGRPLVFC